MRKNLWVGLTLSVLTACATPSFHTSEEAFQSKEVQAALATFQNEGYHLFKLEDVMDSSKYICPARATTRVDISMPWWFTANETKDYSSPVYVYDSDGKKHWLTFKMSREAGNWRWTVVSESGDEIRSGTVGTQNPPSTHDPFLARVKFITSVGPVPNIKAVQDGYTSGILAGLGNDDEQLGTKIAIYSNGVTKKIPFIKN